MKKWLYSSLVLVLIFLIGFPYLFEMYISKFISLKYLDYYSSIFMSLVTVTGVYITVRQSNIQNEKNIVNSSLPVMVPSRFNVIAYEDLFKELNNQREDLSFDTPEEYIESKIDRVYVLLMKQNPQYYSRISKELSSKIKKGGYYWKSDGRSNSLKKDYLLSLPIEFENVGKGSAINVKCGIGLDIDKDPKVINFQTINPNSSVYFHIVTEAPDPQDEGDFKISISYSDIYKKKYKHEYEFSIVKMDDGYYAYGYNFEQN